MNNNYVSIKDYIKLFLLCLLPILGPIIILLCFKNNKNSFNFGLAFLFMQFVGLFILGILCYIGFQLFG